MRNRVLLISVSVALVLIGILGVLFYFFFLPFEASYMPKISNTQSKYGYYILNDSNEITFSGIKHNDSLLDAEDELSIKYKYKERVLAEQDILRGNFDNEFSLSFDTTVYPEGAFEGTLLLTSKDGTTTYSEKTVSILIDNQEPQLTVYSETKISADAKGDYILRIIPSEELTDMSITVQGAVRSMEYDSKTNIYSANDLQLQTGENKFTLKYRDLALVTRTKNITISLK